MESRFTTTGGFLAAICCPGPSLSRFAEPPRADLLIGVNRVCLRWRCDVWACLDRVSATTPPGGIENWMAGVRGSPTLLTCAASIGDMRARGKDWRGEVMTIDQIVAWLPPDNEKAWTQYTATSALAYAGWRGAKRIDVYGADMMGELDWDGTKAGIDRKEASRWVQERLIFATVTEQLVGKGVEVIRHQAASGGIS